MSKYLITHLILSFIIAFIATLLFKTKAQESPFGIFFSLLVFNLLLPFVAYIVSLLLALVVAFSKKRTYLHDVKTFNKEEFLKSPYPQVQRLFGEGAVVSLATDKDNHSPNKMKGLVFMAQNPTKQNNVLIRGLLSDQNNEVRLYSFSLLSAKEEELNKRISQHLSELEKSTQEYEKSNIHTKIAFLYWQFIHLGLIERENEHIMIEKVQYYAKQALSFNGQEEQASLLALLAKTHFTMKEYKEATALFYESIQAGLQKSTIIPYLTEIAFENRDFESVKALMKESTPQDKLFFTNPLYTQWSKS